jgi:predicted nucleic acid-binding protein
VIVALMVPGERQEAVVAHLSDWVESGEDLHPPAVLPYEIVNVLARLAFDGDLDADDVTAICSDLAALNLALHPLDLAQDGPAVAAITTRLRRRHATDSTYIRLAQQLGTDVWTLDGALARNVAAVGFPVRLIS